MDQQHVFAELRKVRTPIIYDTVEQFNLRPRTEGLMDTSVKALLPGLGPIVGYACTAKVVGALPPAAGERRRVDAARAQQSPTQCTGPLCTQCRVHSLSRVHCVWRRCSTQETRRSRRPKPSAACR